MNIRETPPKFAELEKITTKTDTRDYLAKAGPHTEKYKDWLIVDVDAHVNETAFWSEITDRIDNDVMRYIAHSYRDRPGFIVRCSSASAPWMRWASITWWCSRRRCFRSACTRRSMSKWRSATPTIAG